MSWITSREMILWLLLLIALSIFASGLVELVAGLELAIVLLIVLVAMTTGWVLGALSISGWLATLCGLVFGAVFTLVRVGRLGGEIIDGVRAVFVIVGQMFAWLWEQLLYLASYSIKTGEFGFTPVRVIEWATVPTAFGVVWDGVTTMLSRAYAWLSGIFSGSGTYDPVGSVLVWGFVVWVCALWAGWMVSRKRKPTIGILPAGFLLSFLLAYTYEPSGVLLPFLGVLLILIALSAHREREWHWMNAKIDFSRDLWREVAMTALGVSVALVLVSAILPAFSYRKFADWLNELTAQEEEEDQTQVQEIAKSFGVEQKPPAAVPVPPAQLLSSTDLPRRHLIGSGPELRRMVAFVISTGEIPPMRDDPSMDYRMMEVDVPRHYWRSLTYDNYFGQGWATSSMGIADYEAGALFTEPEVPNTRLLRQDVRIIGELGGVVYVDGQFVSVDKDYEVAWRPPNEVFAVTTQNRYYRADSLVPVYTVEGLQAAGTEYPEWILERYLQLPETTPERVRILARDLTATQPTPYDRAVAIESYLREYPYTLDVPAPTRQEDIADYFLFELKEGYCDYYATAMVVLARAAGLPARMVVGYATGNYDIVNARYIVTEADAHAWVEIYFPGYGWVEFEPTAGVVPISRPRETEEPMIWPTQDLEPLVSSSEPIDEKTSPMIVTLLLWIVIGIAGVVLFILGVSGIDSVLLLLRRSPSKMATVLYSRLRKRAVQLQVRTRPGNTPYEFGALLIARLLEIADSQGDEELLPPVEDEIPVLVELYVRAWYSPHAIETAERRAAVWAWWKLQWRLGLANLWRKLSFGRILRAAMAR
ncbi:MAG: transglutaminase domain-containing protein [Anaerolineae bacterium]|nr:transglutaminase domain-containing protein [Anaerolineae bacterium]